MDEIKAGKGERVKLNQQAAEMVRAAKAAKRRAEPGWQGGRGVDKLGSRQQVDWAVKVLEKYRRELDMTLGDVEDEERRREVEKGMGRQLLK